MLFSNILIIFLLQLNYKTIIRNKILLIIYVMIIFSLIDVILITIIIKKICNVI